MDPIAENFLAAYERLAAGKPRNRELRKKAQAGRLRINISTVALEAGRSRTLIALEDCRYPEIRARILGHKEPTGPARSADEAISALRATAAELRRERDLALSEALAHFHARRRAERHAQKWKEAFRRLRDERLTNRGEKVIELIPSEA